MTCFQILTLLISGLTGAGLIFFACRSWLVYRKLAQIEEEGQKLHYDPELMIKGWWRLTGGFEQEQYVNNWRGHLVLCNPGPTPIVVMMWEFVGASPGTRHTVSRPDTDETLSLLEHPVVIPGYSHVRIQVEITGTAFERLDVKYTTAKGGMKVAPITVLSTLDNISN